MVMELVWRRTKMSNSFRFNEKLNQGVTSGVKESIWAIQKKKYILWEIVLFINNIVSVQVYIENWFLLILTSWFDPWGIKNYLQLKESNNMTVTCLFLDPIMFVYGFHFWPKLMT